MRPAIPATFLSILLFSIAASSQTAPPATLGQAPSPFTAEPRDFTKLPPGWRMSDDRPRTSTIVLEPGSISPIPVRPWNDARIDPSIVVYPPKSSLGTLPPGVQIAQNEFPGLLLQPIEWPNLKAQPIPTTWPLFKMQPIPTVWPKFKLQLVQSGQQAQLSPK